MKTNKEIIKNSNDTQVSKIVHSLQKLSQESKFSKTGGCGSVKIGCCYIYIPENENTDIYDNIQLATIDLEIGINEKGFLYASGIKFFDPLIHEGVATSKFIEEKDIISFLLYKDAYERIKNKIISINKYVNEQEKINEKFIEECSK